MASIKKRGNKYAVIYRFEERDGTSSQKWESFNTKEEAQRRKLEIEFQQSQKTFVAPSSMTMHDLLREFLDTYGISKWSPSRYDAQKNMIENYIEPFLGKMKLEDITPKVIDQYYKGLLKAPPVTKKYHKPRTEYVTPNTVKQVHKTLRCIFNQALRWEMIAKNPVEFANPPKATSVKRDIWTAETLKKAMEVCEDPILALAIHLSFACSLRAGELLGLTWDCVDISQEAVDADRPFLYINKELQRCSNESLEKLGDKGIILKFPPQVTWSTSTLVLKAPKTLTSERKVYLPQSLVKMLREHRMTQEEYIALFGEDYTDYNLVFAYPNGRPIEHAKITHLFEDLIKKHNLPPVVFHSLRHSSITYKLKLNGGDMKSVQGDSGHAQLKMVADVYSHIIDEDRSRNARLIEQEFYSGAPAAEEDQPDRTAGKTESDLETLVRLLQNPEIAELAKKLMQN